MDWISGNIVTVIAFLVIPLLGLVLDGYIGKKYVSKAELNGQRESFDKELREVKNHLEAVKTLYVSIDDRMGDLGTNIQVLQERHSNQWQAISSQMASTAKTLEGVMSDVRVSSTSLHALAAEIKVLQGK